MMRCKSLAEMPVRRVEISKIARNHTLKGLRVFSSTVPDVRHVWWPHSAHSNVVPSRIVHTRISRSARRQVCRPIALRSNSRDNPPRWQTAPRTPSPSWENHATNRCASLVSWPHLFMAPMSHDFAPELRRQACPRVLAWPRSVFSPRYHKLITPRDIVGKRVHRTSDRTTGSEPE